MIKIKQLTNYCKKMLLKFEIEDSILKLNEKQYEIVDSEVKLFDEDFKFIPKSVECNNFVYEFGGHWYIQEDVEGTTMTRLKQIGEVKQNIPTNHFIGIHSGNELLNGVGVYEDWIKKAKFLKVDSLGICEKNSVSGAMSFQQQCFKNDIKPIIGMSFEVKNGEETYGVKCYCENFIGWQNILKFSYKFNVEDNLNIEESFLMKSKEGLQIVIDPKNSKQKDYSHITEYYQLDTVIFEEETVDEVYINNLEKFIKSKMKPVMLCDAYYIEQQEWEVREKLWTIAKSFDYRTKNQYFKNCDQYALELIRLFEKGNKSWVKLFKDSQANLNTIVQSCNYSYDTTTRHLPKYEMSKEEQSLFKTNRVFFMHLIQKGFKTRGVKKDKQKEYLKRLKKEIKVLTDGNVIDYFLTVNNVIVNSKNNDVLVGIGRGSAGGCLVSYLLDIIQLDPLELDLIFERFLNPGRMGSLETCEAYEIETTGGTITLNEKSVLKISRENKTINIFVEELKTNDKIISYE